MAQYADTIATQFIAGHRVNTSTRHYHVFVAMPGYLPDNEPEVYRTRHEAEAAAKWHVDGWREYNWDNMRSSRVKITGSARSGCYTIDRGEYTLPIYITIEPCTDRVCADEYADELGDRQS